MSKALYSALRRLQGNGRLAGSAFTSAQKKALDEFSRKTACVRETAVGRGTVYHVVDKKTFDNYWQQLSSRDEEAIPDDIPQRARNIASARDSKSVNPTHDRYYLLLKAAGEGVSWSNGQSTLDLTGASANFGAATLGIERGDDWQSEQTLWLIENQKLFDRLDWLPPDTKASVTYYGGHLSNLLIDWLAEKSRTSRIILFPDYDGVGLMNYTRLQSRTGNNCHFWLMPDWKRLLTECGSNKVWRDGFRDFKSAYDRLYATANAELQQLMNEMQKNALAMEQESIWLNDASREPQNG